MNALSSIQVRAVLIAVTAFYVVPILPLMVLTSAPNFFGDPSTSSSVTYPALFFIAWMLSIAPFCSGYLAAKLAGHQPLLHGLIVGLFGAALELFLVGGDWIVRGPFALIVAISGLFGGWLFRYRNRRRSVGL
jgi:hypothetical protein